ncbi:MAG: PQQ-dependent sugar dehydrogenase [Limisphaerales bacterium]
MVIAALTDVLSASPRSSAVNGRSAEDYHQFAMQRDGDAARGRALFADEQRLACTKCHSTDGKGGKAGPDLFAAGDQFPRRDLIDAILLPSAKIAVGYSTTVVETKSDEVLQGVLKQSTDTWIALAGADGQLTRIARENVQEQRGSTISLMPQGLQAGLTLQEFADLIEYLVSLKEPVHSHLAHQGMPDSIPELSNPVTLRPFLTERLRLRGPREKVQTGLLSFAQVPGFASVFLATDQAGIIWRVEKAATCDNDSIFADFISEVFSARGPNGLLGFAFHPRFRENRKYYLKHQVFENGRIATVLAEKFVSPDFATDSGEPSRRLLKIEAGAEHHNGGCIRFGPDGFLYLGMGDSAPNHDPLGHGQDLRLLLGKMLRLDVDHSEAGLPYAIPSDNPFYAQIQAAQARPEIWAWGFREPWRFSFDPVTGDLWVADLGQERGDEVAIVRRGENHGWNVYEGFELFSHQHQREGSAYVSPIFAGRRKHGGTIVGGQVYRGDPNSSFYGVYIFGDYTSRRIWGLTHKAGLLTTIRQIATSPESITAFSTDERGNVYVVGYEGMVYQMDLQNSKFDELHEVQNVVPNSK